MSRQLRAARAAENQIALLFLHSRIRSAIDAVGRNDMVEAVEFSNSELVPTLFDEVSDEALELAAGDSRGLFCSCGGCNSACSQGSR